MSIPDEDYLRIGDNVVFRSMKFDKMLCADGILAEYLNVDTCENLLDDFLFCIHFQRQYSAAAEFADYQAALASGSASSNKTVARALQKGKNNETLLNDDYMETKCTEILTFGSVIQLFHIKSQKYVTVIPGKLADNERENLRIGLDASGSAFSWIQIAPRFKIDKDGDRVLTNSEMYLKFLERPSEYIHVADMNPVGNRLREVNCSLESSAWKLTIFQSSLEYRLAQDATKKIVLASQIVYINDPETKCNLTIASDGVATLGDEAVSSDDGNGDPNYATSSEEPEAAKSGSNFHHEFGDIVLEPALDGKVSSRMLWFVEVRSQLRGGTIRWKSDTVRFKHLNTGLYLKLLPENIVNGDGEETEEFALTTTNDMTDPGIMFNAEDLIVSNKLLAYERPVRVSRDGIYIERGDVLDNLSYVARGCTAMDRAVNFKLYKYTGEIGAGEDSGSDQKEPLEVFTGLSIRKYLEKFSQMVQVPSSLYISTIWPTADRTDLDMFTKLMNKALYFSQGFPISAVDIDLNVDRAPVFKKVRRQELFRDQGTLEVLLRMIHSLQFVSDRTSDGPQLTKTQSKVTEEEQMMLRMGRNVLEKCFNLLFWCINENFQNQMYVADQMPVLLSHLGGQPIAGKCVTEMLSGNMELQETKIGTREITIFVEKLRSSKMNSMYLELLKACCSCEGNGIDANQCKVTQLLFSNTNDVIIQLNADRARAIPCEWRLDDLYLPSSPLPGSPVEGENLINVGLPVLSLAWTTKSIDFSPLGLFGKLSVLVEELYRVNAPMLGSGQTSGNKKANARKNASNEQKASVAKYFITQMFLCAEMCMDRNYVAMHTVDDMYPYDILVTILRLDVNDSLKSAAARLLLCLHIDRDPQAQTKIPCFTRTWSETMKSADSEPKLPFVEPGRRYLYGLVQQIISDHVRGMSGTNWTEYSKHIFNLLQKMVEFNFYGTNERMQDVIGPLIKALDRRNLSAPKALEKSVSFIETSTAKLDAGLDKGEEGGGEVPIIDETAMDQENSVTQAVDSLAWYRRTLDVMEGLPVMLSVMSVVLASVGVTIYTTISNVHGEVGSPIFIFSVIVDFIFVTELTLRFICAIKVRDTVGQFLCSFFNQIDILVILLDIVFYCLPSSISETGQYTKIIRLIRLIRLLRLVKAAKVLTQVAEKRRRKVAKEVTYTVPIRFEKCPTHELETMVKAVEILQACQSVVEDRNVTLLLKYFYLWECEKDVRSPGDIFEQVVADSQELSLGIEDFDGVFFDCLMFSSNPLVQSCLEIMMSHHSARNTLLRNASQIQLLVSSKRERQYKIVDQMLQQLEQNAETHELWGELQSESDRAISKQTKDIIIELTDICRNRRKVLEFDQTYEADREIQILFRNLGCFNICMKVLGLLDFCEEHVDEETGDMDDVGKNTEELCRLVNILLYWFFYGNPENQELGFLELEFFLEALDANIECHKCIRAIFYGNERLMKMVSHGFIKDMTELICKAEPEERSPHWLALMMAITHVDDKGMRENQVEIMKQLTSPGRPQKISCFFCMPSDPEYVQKVEMMENYRDRLDISVDELPPLLAYHLNLLELFSGCTVGRIGGITSIEAKAQAIFNYEAAMECMLDPDALLLVKIRLGQFIFNAIIEVEMMIPGLEYTSIVWKLLQYLNIVLTTAKEDIESAQNLGWSDPTVSRQKIEFHIVAIQIIGGFFGKYFDYNSFRIDDKASANPNSKHVRMSGSELKALIAQLLEKINAVQQLENSILCSLHKGQIAEAVVALQKNVGKETVIVPLNLSARVDEKKADADEVDELNITLEERILKRYQQFLSLLQQDEKVMKGIRGQEEEFIGIIEHIPFVSDESDSDIRQETLFKKLVQHIRENITIVNNERRLSARCTKTTIWLIKAFRTMLENRMGMTIYERDDDGGAEQDEKCAPVVAALCSCGVTTLCIDLISVGIDPDLQLEAVKLGVGLLFKEGGALEVQTLLNNHLNSTQSDYFFKQLHLSIQKLIEWHRWRDIIVLEDGAEPELPEDLILVRFMQLTAEGHYLPNQDIMREQSHNPVNYNILDDLISYLACLSRLHCRTSTVASIRVAATVLELIQGPCKENQFHFTMKTEVLETLNRIMRSKVILDCVFEEEIELKRIAVDIFQGLLEGQQLKSTVYERMLSVIHLDIILQLSGSAKEVDEDGQESAPAPAVELSEDEELLKTESLVLLQMLCDCKPSIRDEFGLSKNVEDILKSGTSMIEVVWNGDLQRRFFHVPAICDDIAKSSKDFIVENIERDNLENQLIAFVEATAGIYREIKHMQRLRAMGLSGVFNQGYQDSISNFTFLLSTVINGILLCSYTARTGELVIADHILTPLNALACIQIIASFYVLVSSIVIRSPTVFQSLEGEGLSGYNLYFATATDGMTLYYVWFFFFALLGTFVKYYFFSFLLLDILLKNATTRAVLNAVITPRVQLMWATILGIMTIYIFAFYVFAHYSNAMDGTVNGACESLWGCAKLSFWAIQSGGGISDFSNVDFSSRLLLMILFFIMVMTILLNVIFGIIIDTFGGLRQEKDDRVAQTINFCFMCGIDKQTFDRAAVDSSDGFRRHIRVDHCMWSYLKFIIFIWEQDRDDDDGLEQYVRLCVEASDVSWMPLSKAIKLNQAESEEDRLYRESKAVINNSQVSLQSKVDVFQVDLNGHLASLTETLIRAATSDNVQGSISRSLSRAQVGTPAPTLSTEGPTEDNSVIESVQGSIQISESGF